MRQRARVPGRVVAGLVAALVLAPACTDTSGGEVPDEVVDVDAIRAARQLYGTPAQELGTAVRGVLAAARAARLEPAASDATGMPDAAARSFAIDEFERLVGDLDALLSADPTAGDPTASAPDANAPDEITDAWAAARRGAQQLVVGAQAEIDFLRSLLDAESTMAGIAALWDEPGSRSTQATRLEEATVEAQDLVAALADLTEQPPCSDALGRRRDAATVVAERTEQLAGHARRGEGRAYDEAREEFALEPWHDGLPEDDRFEEACWTSTAVVPSSATAVETALGDLVAALNPTTSLPSLPGVEG